MNNEKSGIVEKRGYQPLTNINNTNKGSHKPSCPITNGYRPSSPKVVGKPPKGTSGKDA